MGLSYELARLHVLNAAPDHLVDVGPGRYSRLFHWPPPPLCARPKPRLSETTWQGSALIQRRLPVTLMPPSCSATQSHLTRARFPGTRLPPSACACSLPVLWLSARTCRRRRSPPAPLAWPPAPRPVRAPHTLHDLHCKCGALVKACAAKYAMARASSCYAINMCDRRASSFKRGTRWLRRWVHPRPCSTR